ncbi:hypothetical protein IMSAGC013_00072 [Lachnospiraceae bacterium]|nr:hypothetical protein IMSAGC013_00072 [Lachnospiraceae bacterium]
MKRKITKKIISLALVMAAVFMFHATAFAANSETSNTLAVTKNSDAGISTLSDTTGKAYVIGDGVHFRTSPVNGTIIGNLYYGDEVFVYSTSDGWAYAYSYKHNRTGYVSTDYLTK